jgi:hypothetical protein
MSNLESYLQNPMRIPPGFSVKNWPLPDSHHVAWWRRLRSGDESILDQIEKSLPQLSIPVRQGASRSTAYTEAVRHAVPLDAAIRRENRAWNRPKALELGLHAHFAGTLPVLETPDRGDFLRLYRALAGRCEPIPVPDGVHAVYLSGLPNPGRARELRTAWESEYRGRADGWPNELARLQEEDGTWFYDELIVLHTSPYGDLGADQVDSGLSAQAWLERSSAVRREHESTHHATHRILGSFRLNLHDELLADFMGFTAALGTFRADWFLAAMGVQTLEIPKGARFRYYTTGLSENEHRTVLELVSLAATSLETLANQLPAEPLSRGSLLLALSGFDLAGLGRDDLPERVLDGLDA